MKPISEYENSLKGIVVKKYDFYVDEEHMNDEEWIKINGSGYYADWNNADKKCLRIRIDNYSESTGIVQGCYWYYFDENGKQLTVPEYESK